jgi:hypothetical protein
MRGAVPICEGQTRMSDDTKATHDMYRRLEKIFMPQAMRRREAAGFTDRESKAIRFVHYTSAEAALNIIRTKRMWMRNAMCMTDYSEVQHGFALFNSFFMDDENTKSFVSTLDGCHAELGRNVVTAFYHWSDRNITETYITSISEHDDSEDEHGRLSMWRGFGGNSARVALVFRVPYATEGSLNLNLLFSPVSYMSITQGQDLLKEVVKNVSAESDFLRQVDVQIVGNVAINALVAGAICAKHEGFTEEREWRAIYIPMVRSSPLMESTIESVAGVPQTIYKIPLDASYDQAVKDLEFSEIFDRLIIGPTQFHSQCKEHSG